MCCASRCIRASSPTGSWTRSAAKCLIAWEFCCLNWPWTGNGRLLSQPPRRAAAQAGTNNQEEEMFSKRLALGAGIAAAAVLAAGAAQAQTGADFYKGKTVTYIVSTAPG